MVRKGCLLPMLFVLTVSFSLVGEDDQKCGGNCLNDSCQTCICGEKPNVVDLRAVCQQSVWSTTCCQCMVRVLSKGNANAIVMDQNKVKVGLFQINSYDWITCNHAKAPCDPSANLVCAMQIYKWSGSSWKQYWPEAAEKCGCK